MFRLSLISLFLVAANADLFGNELARQLQDFDLDAFQFNFAGVNINAELAQAVCPTQWQATVSCVISDCPTFMDVCPDLEVPAEFEGTAAPMETPVTPAETDETTMDMPTMDEVVGNVTHMMNDTMTDIMDGDMPAMPEVMPEDGDAPMIPGDEVPSCDEIEEEFCSTLAGEDISDCCLIDCVEQLQSLVTCVVLETTGVDRSDCAIPECPEPAAVDVPATTDSTPAPTSSATGVVSRIAALAASAVAFAML